MKLSYSARVAFCKNPLAKKLFQLMNDKKTNLSLSADVTECEKLLELADAIGPEICILKTHVDILSDFTPFFTKQLQSLAKKHRFFIFEDRKFADIGNTVKNQYAGGIYRIANWADLVNAHSLPGPGIIQGLAEVGEKMQRGLLLLAEMSSANNLLSADYAEKTLAMAKSFEEFVIGFISQRRLSDEPHWIYMTPGVQLNVGGDKLGQQYVTPEEAIIENGTDVIIVGRGILGAAHPVSEARKYRDAGWNAYQSILTL
jgi:orotidine 5'-phosphate decarboxylase subfamily 1